MTIIMLVSEPDGVHCPEGITLPPPPVTSFFSYLPCDKNEVKYSHDLLIEDDKVEMQATLQYHNADLIIHVQYSILLSYYCNKIHGLYSST